MSKNRKRWLAILPMLLLLTLTACRAGAGGGEVGVVRNGGPFDNKQIKDVLCPAGNREYIGMNSSVHYYPTEGVQRYFKITSDPQEGGDFNGVVTAKSADGFNIHLEGTVFFETKFSCEGDGKRLVEDFDKQFGVRKFPQPDGGEEKAAWDGTAGWSAFLNAQVLPLIQNDLRVEMLKFTCEEIVSSCALVASRAALTGDTSKLDIDEQEAKETGVNLQRIQTAIEDGLTTELEDTFGEQYFQNIHFRMSQPKLDSDIETKINQSLGAFAIVSQATAQVEQAKKQAEAAQALAKLYENNPALAELERWRIICGVKAGDNTTSKCGDVTILSGGGSNVLLGKQGR